MWEEGGEKKGEGSGLELQVEDILCTKDPSVIPSVLFALFQDLTHTPRIYYNTDYNQICHSERNF